MKLINVVPDMEKVFGDLEYGGKADVEQRRVNGTMRTLSRTYSFYSDVQATDPIAVKIPGSAGDKQLLPDDKVRVINPRIVPVVLKAGNVEYTEYMLEADDIEKL